MKIDKSMVSLVTTYYPVFKNLNSVFKKNLPILYTNERISDLFTDPPMAALKRRRKLNVKLVKSKIRQPIAQY